MKVSGNELIDILCAELKRGDQLTYDANIVGLLSTMTAQELSQAITFGNVVSWHNQTKEKDNPGRRKND
jgi:hypothetical protein